MNSPDEDEQGTHDSKAESIRLSNLHRMRFRAPSVPSTNRPLPLLPPSTTQDLVRSIETALSHGSHSSAPGPTSRKDRDWKAHEARMYAFRSPPPNTRLPRESRSVPAASATNQPDHAPLTNYTPGLVAQSYDIKRSRETFEEERDRLRKDLLEAKQKHGKIAVLVELVIRFIVNEHPDEQPVVERETVDFGVDEDFVQRDWDP